MPVRPGVDPSDVHGFDWDMRGLNWDALPMLYIYTTAVISLPGPRAESAISGV